MSYGEAVTQHIPFDEWLAEKYLPIAGAAGKSNERPAFRPFAEDGIYRVDDDTAAVLELTYRQLQRYVYTGRLAYVQYPHGRRLRGCDLNDWLAARLHTPDAA